ncbi:hypothetical protein GQ53DRAFT_137430 [Thozetella sp. PMI_491]|nr:hypothetical protein GQ53DRAFT_137430 [Thozetella sp. PMI_491]
MQAMAEPGSSGVGSKKRKIGATAAGDDLDNLAPSDGLIPSSSLNRRHPGRHARNDAYYRHLYTSEIDFRELGRLDPAFRARLNENGQLDFTDPAAVMQLTKTLLEQDFGLVVDLPDDRLCPPVPNRHNYILWLKDLLDTSSHGDLHHRICGLDIGTGASCIYPLLGTAQRPWHFLATDIDERSLRYAQGNVTRNGLDDRIRLLKRSVSDVMIPLDEAGVDSLDFVMTNPPFYESVKEMDASAKAKAKPPSSACTGTSFEMICQGGELAFVRRILEESKRLRTRVQWYTSMFGKLDSLKTFVADLQACGVDNWAVTEFVQGNRTKRWAVAWSYGPMRPAQSVARGMDPHVAKKFLPPVAEVAMLAWPAQKEVGALVDRVNESVGALQLISWQWNQEALRGVGRARENVWSRAWKRKQIFGIDTKNEVSRAEGSGKGGSEECRLGFAITIRVGREQTTMTLRWVEGHDQPLFDSFGGFLKNKVAGL